MRGHRFGITASGRVLKAFAQGRKLVLSICKPAIVIGMGCALSMSLISCHSANLEQKNVERDVSNPAVTVMLNSLGISFPEPLTENDNPYLSYIEAKTGLNVEVIIPPSHRYEDRVGVMMMSNHTPDLISISDPNWVSHYARKQMLAPLDHLIARYAPQLKERIPPEVWEQVSFNGQVYAIPSLNEAEGLEMMYVRKDWLDRFGLKPPETLEELVEMMRAFVALDPDGNGVRDTYGTSFVEDFGRSSPWFGAFGVQLNQWVERDGKLVYSNILPEMKDALAFLRGLVEEGLVDPLFPIQTQRGLERQVMEGSLGLFTGTWYDTRGVLEKSAARHPRAEWIAIPYPQGPGGTGIYALPAVRSYQVIPASSSHAVEALKLLNFISGEGRDTLKFGFEGEVWAWKDGKRVTNMEAHNRDQYRGLYANLSDIPDEGYTQSRLDALGMHYHLHDNLRYMAAYVRPSAFQSLPTPAMTRYAPLLLKKNDMLIDIVLGNRPLDDFERYAAAWLAEGGEEMTREANAWYQYSRNRAGSPAFRQEGSDGYASGSS
ncbi:extracellular solute-binding protein [Paenibacillus apiarius]|uniref:Extracellular solute-binding protein n=1 Tax=Paenibacillus apiarius TaxID=46240 RepID=A0ABT4DS05_9BACL|nr:extracellular solute-binding protein [Paenibacillus apiarius]MCY9514282.1 extracellular solute-binding protein [Paenibacillus apiarius]MCY9520135.1 extracellular solute-binding protein [Paenibacillus apiarius]MCY9550142.1 extracellular solute-binding protein [Paenibacillus apiarius]MCY9560247.1 extracellular solute-binding protein [Paenibacillus apiarius]MCY9683145.1 extracellular solute-binding protein [Paenibacillus apiarius]